MELYMWDLIGGYADNDPNTILKHKSELEQICDKILKGCQDDFIRRDAYVMQGKILHASGNTDEAVALYRDKLPDWYQTAGQKTEQLFGKHSPEFAAKLQANIMELLKFALNKISKQIWFCSDLTQQEKENKALEIIKYMENSPTISGSGCDDIKKALISYFKTDFEAKRTVQL